MLKAIKKLSKRNSLICAVVVTITIAFLSLGKVSGPPINFTYIDKVEHAIAYMVLAFFWLLAFESIKKTNYVVIILCVLFGVLMEVLQSTTSYRTFDYADMLANAIGALIGHFFFKIFTKKKNLVN